MQCLNCNAEIEQTLGKRERMFCNSTCRSNYWQKQKRLKKATKIVSDKVVKENNKHYAQIVVEMPTNNDPKKETMAEKLARLKREAFEKIKK